MRLGNTAICSKVMESYIQLSWTANHFRGKQAVMRYGVSGSAATCH